MAAPTLPRHEIPWGQQRDLDDLADHIGSKRYHGRHRAEDREGCICAAPGCWSTPCRSRQITEAPGRSS